MSKLWSTLVVLTVVAIAGSVFAADAPKKKGERKRPSAEQIFKKLDADKDGKITAEELVKSPRIKDEAKAKEVLGRWDTNKNGSVCVKELTAAFAKHRHHDKKGGDKKDAPKKGGPKKECDKKKK